jgi:hypothetical protein
LIVRPADNHLLLITQPDHAALAAEIMAEWDADGLLSHPRRELVLLATREHDNGWHELDARPLVDESGQIRDFLHMPPEAHTDVWPRGVHRLATEPYAAALVAQHALHLFRERRGASEFEAFFREMERARDRHLNETPFDLSDLARDYFIVRIGDLLSLTFCNAWTEPQREGRYTAYVEGTHLRIDPDPFGGRHVRIAIPARRIENRRFADRDEAEEAFATASVELVVGTAGGA